MAAVKGEWVGVVFNLFTRQIEQIVVPTGTGADAMLTLHEAKNVVLGKSAMRRISRSSYENCRSMQQLANTLMLRSGTGG